MMQHELLHEPSWQYHNTLDSPLGMDVFMGDCEFSTSFTTTEDTSDVSSILYFPSMTPDELLPLPVFADDVSFMFPLEQYSPSSDDLSLILNDQVLDDEIENVFDWMQGMEDSSETSLPSQNHFTEFVESSPEFISVESSLVLPREDMEVDNQLSIPCLLKGYGEAIENEQAELAEVILRCIKEKVSPLGTTMERVAYYFFQALDKQGDYLKQESSKSYGVALRAFYQILPYGRFAHLTANMAILEGIPHDVKAIHIIDFDMGDGVQWPPLMEAFGRGLIVKLTSIKWKEDCDCDSPQPCFQDTKTRLECHAESSSLNLIVGEMDLNELLSEMMNMKRMNTGKEWLVFNCMLGLPHMATESSSRSVTEFLKIAKESIGCNSTAGIITLGEGDGLEEKMKGISGFGSFMNEYLVHFYALFQSMETHFPSHLAEARIAMENLFLAPNLSVKPCFVKWEQLKVGHSILNSSSELQSWKFSRDNLLQAQEIAKEGSGMYSVKIHGEKQNLMSLEYNGTPLVRISTWR